MIKLGAHAVIPTIFPDRTSQVWHVQPEALAEVEKTGEADVHWEFESEAEFMHLAQLVTLLGTYGGLWGFTSTLVKRLHMAYLPYARQDKHVSNESTFALKTFAALVNVLGFQEVTVLDAHSNVWANQIKNLVDKSPRDHIQRAIDESGANLLLFPDKSAEGRYSAYNFQQGDDVKYASLNWVTAEKVRAPGTGEITGFNLGPIRNAESPNVRGASMAGKHVLIVDDLCDAGGTFKIAAKAALEAKAKEVHLYITHGLFTKGVRTLRDSGIKRIWTHKGEVVHDLIAAAK